MLCLRVSAVNVMGACLKDDAVMLKEEGASGRASQVPCFAGMWAHSLTVQDYQDLIDRGWRR